MKKNINLIGISGKGGKALAGELAKREYNVKSFASPVKAIVSLATGISVERLSDPDVLDSYLPMEWDYVIEQRVMNGSGNITRVPVRFRTKVRDMIMKVFTDMGRTAHSNFWVNTFLNTWDGEKVVCDDVQFPNEAEAIRNTGGVLIRLNSKTPTRGTHIRETALNDYPFFDLTLDSDRPVEELAQEVILFVEGL